MAQFFELILDTTAPSSGVLSGLNAYYNSNATVTISADGASFMKVWTNQNANGTTSDSSFPASWEPYGTSKTVSFSGQGAQYVHAQFMDEVGNISSIVNSAATIYDTVAPEVTAVSVNSGDGFTRVTGNTVRVSFSDATSGVQYVTLAGDIADGEKIAYSVTDADRTAGYKDIAVTLQGADGSKSVSATVTDFAGNVSASASDSIVLDTTAAVGTLVLRLADDSANLPSFVNFVNFAAAVETEDNDIVGYKVWEGTASDEPANWTSVTQDPADPRILVDGLALSTGDGTKTINAKIQDIAGNVTTLTAVSVVLDQTAPVVTLSSDVSVISAESGFNTVTFACAATDTNSAEGLSYELKLGDDVIKSGALAASVAVTQAEIEELSAGQGTKSFTLEVTDVAGNTGISTAVVVTLDKTAPTGSVAADAYYNATTNSTVTVTVSGSDTGGAGMDQMKVYLDNNNANWESYAAGTYTFSAVSDGTHVAHVQFKDAVGNVSAVYDSEQFVVDIIAPAGSISTAAFTNSLSIDITVNASDSTSGISQMKVWEAGQTEPEWEAYSTSKSITLAAGDDGQRTINAKFKDAAGNESSATSCSTFLDLDEPNVAITLLKNDGNGLPARVNVTGFQARISHTDAADTAQASAIVAYKLTGDFNQSDNEWQDFAYDSGENYMTISGLTLTTGDGLKTISVQLKDEAGNVSSAGTATVTLDTAPPVIDVNAPDYNKVSKQHTNRLDSTGAVIANKYNDVCIFTWSANEKLVAYKVCVNEVGQLAATAEAIGTAGGSLNMSGGQIDANTDVTSTIFGADFAATSAVNDVDGAYEIIVYGQDEAGTWSAVHSLAAGN